MICPVLLLPFWSEGWREMRRTQWLQEVRRIRNVLGTMEAGYIRPRHSGFVAKQDATGDFLEYHLRHRTEPKRILADLDEIFGSR